MFSTIPDFGKVFEVACYASGVGVGGVLNYKGYPITFFNEKVNDITRRYDTNKIEFYTVVHVLRY